MRGLKLFLCLMAACGLCAVSVSACPQAPWASAFGLETRLDELDSDLPCSSFTTRFTCRYRNFCCFENNECFPANTYFAECVLLPTEQECRSRGCVWEDNKCRRNCPFTSDPSLLCNVLGKVRSSSVLIPGTGPSKTSSPSNPAPNPIALRPTTKSPSQKPTTAEPTGKPAATNQPTLPTSIPSKAPTTRPSASPTVTPTTKFPTVKPTKPPTRAPTKRTPGAKPTQPPLTSSPGWSPETGLTSGASENDPTKPCYAFADEYQCSKRNFCCWDIQTKSCYAPSQTVHDLECVSILDREVCSVVHGKDCVWTSQHKCQRQEPVTLPGFNAQSVCSTVAKIRMADKEKRDGDQQFCFVKELQRPCIFPFTVDGRTFTTCASFKDAPPEKKRGTTTSVPRETWCPLIPDKQTKATDGWGYCTCTDKQRPRSVLMVVADDLRTDLHAAYGRKHAQTPYLDELASRPGSVVFDRAYSNYPVCGPSRASFLSGLLPDTTKIYNFAGSGLKSDPAFRAQIKTLPQVFKEAGFYTLGGGKIFHPGHDDPESWDEYFFPNVDQNADCAKDSKATPVKAKDGSRVPMTCRTTAAIDTLSDFRIANAAVAALDQVVMQQREPFFMTVGFLKPHTPYHVHQRFWSQFNLYGTADAERTVGPEPKSSYTRPLLTFHQDSEILESWGKDPWTVKNSHIRRAMRTAYLAAVAQTDDALGRILVKLEQLKLDKSTMVVFFGDHGYYLGENNILSKHTNFELAVRVPLVFHVPWLQAPSIPINLPQTPDDVEALKDAELGSPYMGEDASKAKGMAIHVIPRSKRSRGFFEMVDIFPTLASLMGLPVNTKHNGTDQSRLVISTALGTSNRISNLRSFAFSQVNRCTTTDCTRTQTSSLYAAGYSVRTDLWRYTVFVHAPLGVPDWSSPVLSEELYSHEQDDETIFAYETGTVYDTEYLNVAAEHPDVCAGLLAIIRQRFGG